MQRSLAASTPEIGFYGEEGGGAALDSGKVWVADPLDGTDQLRDRLAAVRSDARPARGRRADAGRDRSAVPRRTGRLGCGGRRRLARGRDHRDGRRLPPGRRPAGRVPRTDDERAPAGAALPLRRRGVGALGLARQRPDPGHAAGPQQPVRRRRRARDRPRGGSDVHRLRGRPADPGVERSHGGGARHPARARQPRGRSRGGGGARRLEMLSARTGAPAQRRGSARPRNRACPATASARSPGPARRPAAAGTWAPPRRPRAPSSRTPRTGCWSG